MVTSRVGWSASPVSPLCQGCSLAVPRSVARPGFVALTRASSPRVASASALDAPRLALLGCCVGGGGFWKLHRSAVSSRLSASPHRLVYDTDTPQPALQVWVDCMCELAAHIPTKTPRQAPARTHPPHAGDPPPVTHTEPRDSPCGQVLADAASPGRSPRDAPCATPTGYQTPLGAGRSRHRSPTYRTAEAAQPRPHQDKSTKHHSNDEQVPVNLVRREETDCAAWRRATYNTARACGAWAHGPVWTGKLRARVRQDSHKSQV